MKDFEIALKRVKASVSQKDLEVYSKWNKEFGTFHSEGESQEDDEDMS